LIFFSRILSASASAGILFAIVISSSLTTPASASEGTASAISAMNSALASPSPSTPIADAAPRPAQATFPVFVEALSAGVVGAGAVDSFEAVSTGVRTYNTPMALVPYEGGSGLTLDSNKWSWWNSGKF